MGAKFARAVKFILCHALVWPLLLGLPLAFAADGELNDLLRLLEEGGSEQRRNALLALADKGDFNTVPPVAAMLHDRDMVARELAEKALWSIWSRSGDVEADELLRMGSMLLANGQLARAVAVFDAVIQRNPGFAEGYNKRATALYHLGEYRKSLDDIDETLKLNPYHFGALSGAGLCMIGLERLDSAIIYFDRALKINPNMEGIITLKERIQHKLTKLRI